MAKEHLGIQEPAYVLLGKIEAKPMYLLEVRSARGKAFLNQGLVDMFFFFFFFFSGEDAPSQSKVFQGAQCMIRPLTMDWLVHV